MKSIKTMALALAGTLFIMSCNQASKSKAVTEDATEIAKESSQIPAPKLDEVVKALNESGASFVFDITNPTSSVSNYVSVREKSLALGVYGADLAYLVIYHKQEEIDGYFNVYQQLIQEREIKSVGAEILNRVRQNLTNKDSLMNILGQYNIKLNEDLNQSERYNIATNILAGSTIEGMYLIQQTFEFASDKKPLQEIILKRKEALSNVIKLMSFASDSTEDGSLLEELKALDAQFDKAIANPTDEEAAQAVRNSIKVLRSKIV